MRHIESLLEEYGESHRNRVNVYIHALAVPAIYFSAITLLWSIPPLFLADFGVTWAHLLALPVLYYYFKLSGPIGAAMTLVTIGCFAFINLLIAYGISVWQFGLAVFVLMWILQFLGHHIEGRKPSFLKDIEFLLVGPAWWCCHWLRRFQINY